MSVAGHWAQFMDQKAQARDCFEQKRIVLHQFAFDSSFGEMSLH